MVKKVTLDPNVLNLKNHQMNEVEITQVKINLINKYQVDSEEEELINELDFESKNLSVYI